MPNNRIFALEEAYVTIFEEYSPFFNAPVLPQGRKRGVNGWELTYDLSLYSSGDPAKNLALWDRTVGPPRTVYARWDDLFMSDLKWDRRIRSQSNEVTGLPHGHSANYGTEGQLSFGAAHFGTDLEAMLGFNKFWRIFVDKKRTRRSPVEQSWMFSGAWVRDDNMGGSPFAIQRSWEVKEFTKGDAMYVLHQDYRFALSGYKLLATGETENIPAEVMSIERSRRAPLVPLVGGYQLTITAGTNTHPIAPLYKLTYNGVVKDNFAWIQGSDVYIDGLAAGVITLRLTASVPPNLGVSDTIIVA